MQVGLANSVFKEHGYDFLKTLGLCAGKCVEYPDFRSKVAQLYLNPGNVKDKRLLESAKGMANEFGISLVTHISNDNDVCDLESLVHAHGFLLEGQPERMAVVHYDNCSEKLVDSFNKAGMMVCVENYHNGIAKREEFWKFFEFFKSVSMLGIYYEVGAVLDFGRYFIFDDENSTESLVNEIVGVVMSTYKNIVGFRTPVLFHTVGTKSYRMAREDRVPPGSREDLIPQEDILKGILGVNKEIRLAKENMLIVESESVEHGVLGVNSLRGLLSRL